VAYVTLVDGKIKFRENNDWANNYGDNGADGSLESGGADIDVTAGDYKILFNPVDKTYSLTKFSWGLVGSAYNDWGAAGPDAKFVYDDATDQWRLVVKLMDGKFKIRKNNDWGLNYGDNGADGTLEAGGADIEVTAGKYLITFNENDLTIQIDEIPNLWGLVGSAYNDWGGAGPDAQFIPDWRNEGVWILKNVTLLNGKFKVRDDNDWGLNYGDNGADGTLESGGADIDVTAGVYTITLDFSDPANPTWSQIKY
jgi:starch-binding outer membrane protein SusE/F